MAPRQRLQKRPPAPRESAPASSEGHGLFIGASNLNQTQLLSTEEAQSRAQHYEGDQTAWNRDHGFYRGLVEIPQPPPSEHGHRKSLDSVGTASTVFSTDYKDARRFSTASQESGPLGRQGLALFQGRRPSAASSTHPVLGLGHTSRPRVLPRKHTGKLPDLKTASPPSRAKPQTAAPGEADWI
ncbi:hypothetical protein JCM11491_003950 [Sporobolomyces phaffii]